jgi:uncharacterized membrane protein
MSRLSPYLLAATLAGVGVTHFRSPAFYDQMVPPELPGPPRAWTYASGAAELALAVAVVNPRTRRRGALASALFFVAVFPGNLQMARNAEGPKAQALTYARLPLQLPLVRWAWRVSRASARSGS